MLRAWLATPALKRVLQNFMVLASGRAAAGVLGLIATLLSARALGPEDFGTLAADEDEIHRAVAQGTLRRSVQV